MSASQNTERFPVRPDDVGKWITQQSGSLMGEEDPKFIVIDKKLPQLLNFPAISTWHTGFMTTLTTAAKAPYAKDDAIAGRFGGVGFEARVLESSPYFFSWTGPPLYGLLRCTHSFHFVPSQTTPGGTTFTQEEGSEGWMAWVFVPWGPVGRRVAGLFEGFNRDLKRRCESEKEKK
ncbi:hypothetical protein MMC13_004467 [Lambiella insularis]|nr:hypothetical protein [Lambiella insularis]